MDFIDKYILLDSRFLSEVIHSPIVDVVITSPPYWNMKDYSAPDQIGFGQTKDDYLKDIEQVLSNCFDVTKPTGSMWLVVDTYRLDGELQLLPWEIAERAKNVGWHLKDMIIWDKQHNVPWQQKGQMRHVTEFVLFFTKGNDFKYYLDRVRNIDELSKWWADFPERFNPKGKTPSNIWTIPVRLRGTWPEPSEINHHCPFPTGLVARIIELTTDEGDLVMDPFSGSGVVLAQAEELNRHYIGFDINSDFNKLYEDVIKKKVKKEWQDIQHWRLICTDSIKDFEQTNLRLRSLKYSWQLLKSSINDLAQNDFANLQGLVSIASIPLEYEQGVPFRIEVFIIVNEKSSIFENMISKIEKRSRKCPLTNFGIEPRVHLVSSDEILQDDRLLNLDLYLYDVSKFRKPALVLNLSEWLILDEGIKKIHRKKNMYLLSNVEIDLSFISPE